MISGIKAYPLVRKAIVGTLLLGSVAAGSYNAGAKTVKNNQSQKIEQRDIIPDAYPPIRYYYGDTYSKLHNFRLDNKVLDFCYIDELVEDKQYIDSLYKTRGTFGATLALQSRLSFDALDYALTIRLDDEFQKSQAKGDKLSDIMIDFNDWLNKYDAESMKYENQLYAGGEKVSAEEVSRLVSDFVSTSGFFTNKQISKYEKAIKEYSKSHSIRSPFEWSNFIAYQIFVKDNIAFSNKLTELGIFDKINKDKTWNECYVANVKP